MKHLGFVDEFTQLIMKCVTTVTYRFRVNGDITDAIVPGKGLQQGDPISPYLFLIYAEGFSTLLHQAKREGKINGIKIAPTAPTVNHLLFTDDS